MEQHIISLKALMEQHIISLKALMEQYDQKQKIYKVLILYYFVSLNAAKSLFKSNIAVSCVR